MNVDGRLYLEHWLAEFVPSLGGWGYKQYGKLRVSGDEVTVRFVPVIVGPYGGLASLRFDPRSLDVLMGDPQHTARLYAARWREGGIR